MKTGGGGNPASLRPMVRKWEWHFALLALACLAAAFLLAKGADTTLPATDAANHAALALAASAHGWLPRFPIGIDSPAALWGASGYNDHPFVPFLLMGKVMRLFGPTAWSAKLLPALFSIVCVLETAWLGILLRSRLTGMLAALMLALTRPFWMDALNNHLDNFMIVFILASFIAWEKRRPLLAGALAGMGIWFKTPVALLLFPAVFAATILRGHGLAGWRKLGLALLTALGVGSLVWWVVGLTGGWEIVRDYWGRQLWGTAVGGRARAQGGVDPLVFFRTLGSQFVPWYAFTAFAIAWAAWRGRLRRPGVLIPLCAAGVLALAISLIRFKYGHYFTPAYPFLCLLAVQPLASALQRHETWIYRGLAAGALLLSTVVLCSPIEPSPESFPALRRFLPYIQAQGSCREPGIFVHGAHPYGDFGDYEHLLAFYAGRRLLPSDCAHAAETALGTGARWILVAGQEYRGCLPAQLRSRFARVYQYRDEFLLVEGAPEPGPATDLTPLGRELRATLDCEAPALPSNRYEGAVR